MEKSNSKKIELSIEDLKIRDKILKTLSNIELVSLTTKVKGDLFLRSSDFGFDGYLSEFDSILCSIYQYKKKEHEWLFNIGEVKVHFTLHKPTKS